MTVFLRVLEAPVDDKSAELLRAIGSLHDAGERNEASQRAAFVSEPAAFAAVPGSPFCYWVSNSIRRLFTNRPAFASQGRVAASGGKTLDDFRWIRTAWEIEERQKGYWVGFAKGGAFSPYYSDIHLLLDWRSDARGLKDYLVTYRSSRGWSPNWTAELHGSEHYFRPGLTWPRRTNGLSFRAMPRGCIFADKGPAAFVENDLTEGLLALSALLNSQPFGFLVAVQLARTELAQSYEVGIIQQTPIPNLSTNDTAALARDARRAWSLKRSLDTANEISHAFLLPRGLNEKVTGLDPATIERELESIQRQIDDAAFALYGISPEDRAAIEASSKRTMSNAVSDEEEPDDEGDEASEEEAQVSAGADAFHSWLVGAAFGRFDPRLATGERAVPQEPEPFAPLPSRSPGMWPEGDEPAERADILVDDEGHADDLAARARAIADRIKVDAPDNLRAWLAKEFFPLHIKMYSKSRRKAPIYWQIATSSASYSVWLYIHAFSKDTLFRVQNDYASPKLAHEERRLESLRREIAGKSTAAQRKELAAQETFVEELRAFLEEVRRAAPLWNPTLDDGVVINFAPLWRLVPQNKSWQKELKSTWDALCEGKYDWAHLAMHLWPKRVVPKCAKDRSLAIAHGLEDVFWVEGTDGKWTARKTPTLSVDELVCERISPAVESAVKGLLEAPAVTGNGRRSDGRRRATAAAMRGDA